jgi:hypothetical protein
MNDKQTSYKNEMQVMEIEKLFRAKAHIAGSLLTPALRLGLLIKLRFPGFSPDSLILIFLNQVV